MMRIKNCPEAEEFVHKCKILESVLLSIEEYNDRVWIAVMCERMKDIIVKQENPDRSLDQLINTFKKWKNNVRKV